MGMNSQSCALIQTAGSPGGSAGEESTSSAGDPGLIPGLASAAGEGTGYPAQCSWGPLVAQLVKNLPAVRETWVGSLGWDDPLEKGKAPHSSILAWRIPWTVQSMGSQRVGHNRAPFATQPVGLACSRAQDRKTVVLRPCLLSAVLTLKNRTLKTVISQGDSHTASVIHGKRGAFKKLCWEFTKVN